MLRYPLICLGIILRLVCAISESLPGPHLHASSSNILQAQETPAATAYVLSMKITNYIYSPSLEDDNSDDYVTLSKEVSDLLQEIFGCDECDTGESYAGAANIAFRNGSVIADATVVFKTNMITNDVVRFTFCNAFLFGTELQSNLTVDPTYTLNLPPPVLVPVPLMTTTQPTTTSRLTTTHQSVDGTSTTQHHSSISTTPQPTTTSLFPVPTSHKSEHNATQYYSSIASSTHDTDLSKGMSPSHNIIGSTYTSTTDPITNTITSLPSKGTNGLIGSSTTLSKPNSEFTYSTTPSSHGTKHSTTTVSEYTSDLITTSTSLLSGHVTNGMNYSDTTLSDNTTDATHITATPPSSMASTPPFNSASTLSKNATDSTNTTTIPLSRHTTNGIINWTTTLPENTTDSSDNTRSPPLIHNTSHTTRGSFKTDSNTSPPKATTSITNSIHWSATSKSGTTSTPSRTVNPHHNATSMTSHSASHINTQPKAPSNTSSSHNHSHVDIVPTIKSSEGGVPGWGIALLVLASVILLLLIILFILALWRWCCHQEDTGLTNVTGNPKPYDRQPSAPEFLPMDPYQKIYPDEFEKPKKNRTGMYIVNP